jgi:hypothetical protein
MKYYRHRGGRDCIIRIKGYSKVEFLSDFGQWCEGSIDRLELDIFYIELSKQEVIKMVLKQ